MWCQLDHISSRISSKYGVRGWGLLICTFIIAATCGPTFAVAAVQWKFTQKNHHPYLQGFSGEYEGDNVFWALCRSTGIVDVGAGADSGVGKGTGEKVSLTLSSAGRSVSLQGSSRKSENFELTGGTELRTTVSIKNDLFLILKSGKPIKVVGSIEKPTPWSVDGLMMSVGAFLTACKRQDQNCIAPERRKTAPTIASKVDRRQNRIIGYELHVDRMGFLGFTSDRFVFGQSKSRVACQPHDNECKLRRLECIRTVLCRNQQSPAIVLDRTGRYGLIHVPSAQRGLTYGHF